MTDFASVDARRGVSTGQKLTLGFAIGIGFLWLSVRHLHLHQVLAVILDAEISWLAIAFALYAGNLAIRVQRWRLLLHGHDNLLYRKVGAVLLSGYGLNFLLPARIGELFRVELMRRRHGVARAVVFSGIVIERILDGLCVVLLLGIGLWATRKAGEHSKALVFVNVGGALVFGAAVLGWILLQSGPLTTRFSRWPRVAEQLHLLHQSFSAVAGRRLLLVVGLTGIVYVYEAGALWAICRALELHLRLPELMVLVGAAALSTLIPSAPGFVGTFQMAFVLTFGRYHQPSTLAVAAATLVQLLLFGPLIVGAVPTLLHGSISFSATLAPGTADRGASAGPADKPPTTARISRRMDLARRGAAIALLVFTIFLSRNIGQSSFGATNQDWWRMLIHLGAVGQDQSPIRDLVTPNSGEQVLPPLVRDMLSLLRKRDIQEYALSPQIWADVLWRQRISESAFPKRMMPTARYLLALAGEKLPAKCRPVAFERGFSLEGIKLAACD
jgi:glycosyltransferase 2 family protein